MPARRNSLNLSGPKALPGAIVLVVVAVFGEVHPVGAQSWDGGGLSPLGAAIRRVIPHEIVATAVDGPGQSVMVTGAAGRHEDVAELMRSFRSLARTPRGIGRITQRVAARHSVLVEFFQTGVTEFPETDVIEVDVELKSADRMPSESGKDRIQFEISVRSR